MVKFHKGGDAGGLGGLLDVETIGGLSGASLANGNAPVEFSDFTRGDWNKIDGFHRAVKE